MKGPSQTLAQNESERDSAERVGELAKRGEALHRDPDVIGVGMMGTETCVTEGDLVGSERRRLRHSERLPEGGQQKGVEHARSQSGA